MGQKTHPTGFRLGVIKTWQGRWCAPRVKLYTQQLHEDLAVRSAIMERLPDAGISRVEIERGANQLTATIYTARPGIVIGRGGQRVDELRLAMEELTGKRVRINIQEIRVPDLEANLVARSIAEQLERACSLPPSYQADGESCAAARGVGGEGALRRALGRF